MLTLLFASAIALSSPAPTQTQTTPVMCVPGYDADCTRSSSVLVFEVPEGATSARMVIEGVTDNEPQREECADVEINGTAHRICAGAKSQFVVDMPKPQDLLVAYVAHLGASDFTDPGECPWNPDKPWLYRLWNACTPGSMHVTVRVEFAFPPAPTTIATTTTVKPTDVATVKVEQESPTTLVPTPSIADPTIVEPTLPETGTSATRLVPWALLLMALGTVLHVQSRRRDA